MAGRVVPVFTPPTPAQRRALAVAASYLSRAGTEAATRLLPDRRAVDIQSALLADMGDSMTSAATLYGTGTAGSQPRTRVCSHRHLSAPPTGRPVPRPFLRPRCEEESAVIPHGEKAEESPPPPGAKVGMPQSRGPVTTLVAGCSILSFLAGYAVATLDGREEPVAARPQVAARATPTREPDAVGTAGNPATVGDTLVADGLAVTLHSASRVRRVTGRAATPASGNTFVVFDVTIRNFTDRDERRSEKQWSAEDTRRGLAFGTSLAGDNHPSERLGANSETRGTVVIEVGPNTRTVRVGYGGKPLGEDDLYWNVRVQ